MKFELNGLTWTIKEKGDLTHKDAKDDAEYAVLGLTMGDTQEIWLLESLPEDAKKRTLLHELVHCYRYSFLCGAVFDNQSEEVWCDLIANSHDVLHEITEKYFCRRNKDVRGKTNKNKR